MKDIAAILKTRRGGAPITWTEVTLPFQVNYPVVRYDYIHNVWAIASNGHFSGDSYSGYTSNLFGAWTTTRDYTDPSFEFVGDMWLLRNRTMGGLYFDAVYATYVNGPYTKLKYPFVNPYSKIMDSCVYHNGLWVGLRAYLMPHSEIWTTTNLNSTWTLRYTNAFGLDTKRIIYGDDGYYATYSNISGSCGGMACVSGPSYLIYSNNPTGSWSTSTVFPFGAGFKMEDIAYGNGYWVAIGSKYFYEQKGYVAYSTSPAGPWTVVETPHGSGTTIKFGNGAFVIVGASVPFRCILTTIDPSLGWVVTEISHFLEDVWYGEDGHWVGVGSGRPGHIYVAQPGI